MKSIRIGVDVGGTNTDAVLLVDRAVEASIKTPTTPDVTEGVRTALRDLVARAPDWQPQSVMIGTTHFVNAVVQRRELNRAAALRICLPASASLPPLVDWPRDLASVVEGGKYLVAGGHEYDGRVISELDELAIAEAARKMRRDGIRSVAVTAVFSPLTDVHESRAAQIIQSEHPDARITCSHTLGRIGLLERENVSILNASLTDLAARTVDAFAQAVSDSGLDCPLYITQNDGTVASAQTASRFPVFSFASGPTNSMRGAMVLSGLKDAMVCDVGGTTTDVGCLVRGFPRQANNTVEVGGVRTLFRMPDLISIGLGGGSIVDATSQSAGPASVAFELPKRALVFGGDTLTATDVAVAASLADIGNPQAVSHLSSQLVEGTLARMQELIYATVDRMKPDARELPLLAVGGGAMLVPDRMEGISDVVRMPYHDVANAVGAAVAQVAGEVDKVYQDLSRDDMFEQATELAKQRAVDAGAQVESLEVIEREDLPLAYLPGNSVRARVRVVGDLRQS